MNEWLETTLGELCEDISYGYTASASTEKVGPRFLRITDIVSGRLNWETIPYCEITNDKRQQYLLEEGDIVIARTGATTGATYTWKNTDDYNTVYASYLIRYKLDKKRANPKFVDFLLRSNNWAMFVESIKGGSAQPGANAKQFASYDIFLPPMEEQKAITAVLASLDDKINLLHRQNKTLESLAQTLFHHWFLDNADNDWEEKPLQNVVDITIGRTPPRKEFHWFSTDSSDVKWLSIKDLGNEGVFIFETAECLTPAAVKQFRIPLIPQDTVVLSFKMTVGRVGITTEPTTTNEAIAHFKFNSDTPFTKEYLYFYLKLFRYEELGSTSTIVTSINSRMIKAMMIPIPDFDTMNKFKKPVQTFFNKIQRNQVQIHTLEKLRDTLLPKLMSGEVRVRQN